ncbi:MAG: DUF488 domain-containing protein [Planctomycetota bacterium]|jgi:uncharacterized protein (DUF488 family)
MKVIHTMGLGNRSLEVLLDLLARARVTRVVDIRRYGSSSRYPHHEATSLHRELRQAGYEVCDLGDLLGGDRKGGYRRYMESASFRHGLARLTEIAEAGPTVLLCAEREPERCHRQHLAELLESGGWTVAHHVLTKEERVARGDLRLVRKTG